MVGKSYFTCFVAACVTAGRPFPNSSEAVEKGRVLLLAKEDNKRQDIYWRLSNHHAELSMVQYVERIPVKRGSKKSRLLDLSEDLDLLERSIKQWSDLRLIVIDPLQAYIGKSDINRANEMFTILDPITELAEKYNLNILCPVHMNKSQQQAVQYRIPGSIAIAAVPRMSWLIAKDKDDAELRHFVPLKHNPIKKPEGLSFRITDEGLVFQSGVETPTADELVTVVPDAPAKAENTFLAGLTGKGELPAAELYLAAKQLGISERQLKKAKKEMEVDHRRLPDNSVVWIL
jgi:hypothetical protein